MAVMLLFGQQIHIDFALRNQRTLLAINIFLQKFYFFALRLDAGLLDPKLALPFGLVDSRVGQRLTVKFLFLSH